MRTAGCDGRLGSTSVGIIEFRSVGFVIVDALDGLVGLAVTGDPLDESVVKANVDVGLARRRGLELNQ